MQPQQQAFNTSGSIISSAAAVIPMSDEIIGRNAFVECDIDFLKSCQQLLSICAAGCSYTDDPLLTERQLYQL